MPLIFGMGSGGSRALWPATPHDTLGISKYSFRFWAEAAGREISEEEGAMPLVPSSTIVGARLRLEGCVGVVVDSEGLAATTS